MKIHKLKKNERRRFFNSGKGDLCATCGALLVNVTNLNRYVIGKACPVPHAA